MKIVDWRARWQKRHPTYGPIEEWEWIFEQDALAHEETMRMLWAAATLTKVTRI